MRLYQYIKSHGIIGLFQVIWRYKIDLVIKKIIMLITKNKPLKDVIVIEGHNDFDSNGGAFYDFLISRGYNKNYRIVWLLKGKNNRTLPQNVSCHLLYKPSIKKNYDILTAKYILTCNDAIGSYRKGQKSYFLTHGAMALKNVKGNLDFPESLNYLLCPSAFIKPIQARMVLKENSKIKQIIIGFPCHDVLYSKCEGDLKNITEKTYNKVVLWMPTFRSVKNSDRVDSDYEMPMGIPLIKNEDEYIQLSEYLKATDILMIIKIHPMQKLTDIKIRSTSHILVLDGNSAKERQIDNYKLMKDVDALITDYSSAGTDFLHTNKPLAYTIDDIRDYKLGFIVENVESLMPGSKLSCIDDLIGFCRDIYNNKDDYKEARKIVLDKMFDYQDGNSCERLAEHMGLRR